MKPSAKRLILPRKSVITLASAALLASGQISAYESEVHTFSVYDTLGDFEGSTYGTTGIYENKSIICGLPDSTYSTCPEDAAQPFVDRSGVTLYPVDSEYGFYVVDFVGAQEKAYDEDYGEGFVGPLPDGSGIAVSNAATDRYKVKPPRGTWCQGLGGNSVKCSTEHYTVMEHVLSYHEVIPYFFADPEADPTALPEDIQGVQSTPDGSLSVNCADTALDDELLILVDGSPTTQLTDATPGAQMEANDNTSVLDDLAVSADYSVTLKDDGKPLYRWGGEFGPVTSLVRYAPGGAFPEHTHPEGEEILVLEGEFTDEHGEADEDEDPAAVEGRDAFPERHGLIRIRSEVTALDAENHPLTFDTPLAPDASYTFTRTATLDNAEAGSNGKA